MEFYSVENYEVCWDIFQKYLTDTYNVSMDQLPTNDIKVKLYNEIRKLYNTGEYIGLQLKDANNLILNRLRHSIADNMKLVKSKKPVVKTLNREQSIYGNRKNMTLNLTPTNTNIATEKNEVNKQFELLMQERNQTPSETPPSFPGAPPVTDAPIKTEDWEKMMTEVEQKRDIHFQDTIEINEMSRMSDPKDLYAAFQSTSDAEKAAAKQNYAIDFSGIANTSQQELIPPSERIILTTKYISISGTDRDSKLYPFRFSYKVELGPHKFRNIHSIQLTRLIIPTEIHRKANQETQMKANFVHEFGLSFPYISVNIDEINGLYEGSNDNVRKCSCIFLYDSMFKSHNGRGYTVLKPIQDEIKYYIPAPLGSLPVLNISVRKPNGTLFNSSVDDYNIQKLDYNETSYRLYLQVILEKYFDVNEFFTGDIIVFRDFKLKSTGQDESSIQKFDDFMNRSEGHEVVEVGAANQNGFCRSFFIFAPAEFSPLTGKLELNTELIDVLKKSISNAWTQHQQELDARLPCSSIECTDPMLGSNPNPDSDALDGIEKGATLINMSLQNLLTMKITTKELDASILNKI